MKTHEIGLSLLKVLEHNKNKSQIKCFKALPAHLHGHRKPEVVTRATRETYFLVATSTPEGVKPVSDLQILDIASLSDVQPIPAGCLFEAEI